MLMSCTALSDVVIKHTGCYLAAKWQNTAESALHYHQIILWVLFIMLMCLLASLSHVSSLRLGSSQQRCEREMEELKLPKEKSIIP